MLHALLDEFDITLSKERQAENNYFEAQTLENLRERILAIRETYKIHASALLAPKQSQHKATKNPDLLETSP